MEAADLIVLMTVLFAGGAGAAVLAALDTVLVAVVFFTTVAVLPLLDSLVALSFRLPRVDAAVGGRGMAAACRVRVAAVPVFELAADDAVTFLEAAVGRVPFAFSTILDKILDEAFGGPFRGDAGLLIIDFVGDAGRSRGELVYLKM